MTPRRRMSENEKVYFFVLLFPPLWPLALAMVLCDLGEAIGRWFKTLYQKIRGSDDTEK